MKQIVPECYADTYLVEILLKRGKPRHQKGIHKVKETVEKLAKELNKFAAVIDKDKDQHHFYNSLETISDEAGVLHKKKGNINYFILEPAIEQFILNCCESSNIDISDFFKYSNDLHGLRNLFKSPAIESNHDFKRLINELINKNSAGIIRLQTLLETCL